MSLQHAFLAFPQDKPKGLKCKVNKWLNLSTKDLINDHCCGKSKREQRPKGRGANGPAKAGLVSARNPVDAIAQDEDRKILPVPGKHSANGGPTKVIWNFCKDLNSAVPGWRAEPCACKSDKYQSDH